eukprot:4359513-Pleurochrysis_carterae.AAC.4
MHALKFASETTDGLSSRNDTAKVHVIISASGEREGVEAVGNRSRPYSTRLTQVKGRSRPRCGNDSLRADDAGASEENINN